MKLSRLIWVIMALIIAMGLSIAACGDDDDDDDDNDTGGDDDDDDDDDDVTSSVEVTNLSVSSTCGEAEPDPTTTPINVIEARWQNQTLHIWRTAALLNCEPDLSVEATLDSSVLTINETDAGGADCDCTRDVEYDIEGIGAGQITVVINYNGVEKMRFVILTNSDDYAWKMPDLAGISQLPPGSPYPANQAIPLRVNACHIEDPSLAGSDPLKLQIFYVKENDMFFIYTLDRRNLTTPGTISENCGFYDFEIAGQAAGSYDLIGLGFDYDDTNEFNVSFSEIDVE